MDFNTNKRESQGFPKACKWWYKNLIGIETYLSEDYLIAYLDEGRFDTLD